MPTLKVSRETMALLLQESKERDATVKDIAEFCIHAILEAEEEDGEQDPEGLREEADEREAEAGELREEADKKEAEEEDEEGEDY